MRTRLLLAVLLAFHAVPALMAAQDSGHERKVITKVSPLYPDLARKMQLQGVVKLEVLVAPDGTVKNVKVIGGSPLLVSAAESAIRKWRFAPADAQTSELIKLNFVPN
jgi:protein TonB